MKSTSKESRTICVFVMCLGWIFWMSQIFDNHKKYIYIRRWRWLRQFPSKSLAFLVFSIISSNFFKYSSVGMTCVIGLFNFDFSIPWCCIRHWVWYISYPCINKVFLDNHKFGRGDVGGLFHLNLVSFHFKFRNWIQS